MDATPTPAAGHNQPPSEQEIIQDKLREKYKELIDRRDTLLASFTRSPGICTDDETDGKLADLKKLITGCDKAIEGARVAEKEPYLMGERAVDGYFKFLAKPLTEAAAAIQRVQTDYKIRKEREARLAAEAEARRRAEEAERQRAEFEARERAALEAQRAAEAAQRAAEEAAAKDRAHAAKLEADAKAARERAERQAKETADAEAAAASAQKAANVKPAELSRGRGELGAVSSLRTTWTFDPATLNRHDLDLEKLRPYLPLAAIETAIRGYIKAGGRELAGVTIFEQKVSVTR